MNIAGEATFGGGKRSKLQSGLALVAGALAVGVLASVGVWQATKSDEGSSQAARLAPVARPVAPQGSGIPSYFYLVESAEQAATIAQADYEAQLTVASLGLLPTHNTTIVDVSTLEGRQLYEMLAMDTSAVFDQSLVQIFDYTSEGASVAAAKAVPAPGGEQPADGVSEATRPFVPEAKTMPTYYFIVDSQERADQVLQAENESALELAQLGMALDHNTQVIDVSTAEGQQFFNALSGELMIMSAEPSFDWSLIQIFDAR
jgi:hypothetical protein